MQVNLLTAVRTVVRADSNPVRQALFAILRQTSAPVGAVGWLYDKLRPSRSSSLLVSAYGLKSWLALTPGRRRRARILAVAGQANAIRRVEVVARAYGEDRVDRLRTGTTALLSPDSLRRLAGLPLSLASVRRFIRLVHRINTRGDLLVSCRVASVLGCYVRARQLLADRRPAGVLVSSASNPEEIALVAAAKSLRIPTIFVSHAYTTSVSPRLDFSLSILEGEAAVEAYARKGPIRGEVFLGGVEGVSHPMNASRLTRPQPVIGILTPKVVAWPLLSEIIDVCRQRFHAQSILIRWHPSMLERPTLARHVNDLSAVVETPRDAELADVASKCDWVIADPGSNVHLPVLKMGIPTIAIRRMGVLQDRQADQYGFVAAGVVFPPLASLAELIVPDAVAFYSGEWAARFRRHDAAYLQSDGERSASLIEAIDGVLVPTRDRVPPVLDARGSRRPDAAR